MVSKMWRWPRSTSVRPWKCPPRMWMKSASSTNSEAHATLSLLFHAASNFSAISYKGRSSGVMTWTSFVVRLFLPVQVLHDDGDALAAADTCGRESVARLAPLQLIHQRDEQACARCAQRMPQRYRAAI